jgi:hypothetical protein
MMEYEAVRERQDAIRRSVERELLAMSARPPRRPLRVSAGTGLARLGVLLAGRPAIRAVLGEAR